MELFWIIVTKQTTIEALLDHFQIGNTTLSTDLKAIRKIEHLYGVSIVRTRNMLEARV